MPWPTDEAVERAWRGFMDADYPDVKHDIRAGLEAAGLPELFGVAEAAAEYGVATGNLDAVSGLPAPVCRVKATRLWIAEDIRAHAAERRRG